MSSSFSLTSTLASSTYLYASIYFGAFQLNSRSKRAQMNISFMSSSFSLTSSKLQFPPYMQAYASGISSFSRGQNVRK